MWMSKVSNEDFKRALISSMKRAGIFDDKSELHVTAVLAELEQPFIGASLTVTATVIHPIVDGGGKSVFEQKVVSPSTANFSDAFLAAQRLQLANEGAIRENIGQFMALLAVHEFAAAGV